MFIPLKSHLRYCFEVAMMGVEEKLGKIRKWLKRGSSRKENIGSKPFWCKILLPISLNCMALKKLWLFCDNSTAGLSKSCNIFRIRIRIQENSEKNLKPLLFLKFLAKHERILSQF